MPTLSSRLLSIPTILVPQGAEHQAVYRGLRQAQSPPIVIPIPIGAAVEPFLKQFEQQINPPVLIMGLCGSLNPLYKVGNIAVYKNVIAPAKETIEKWECSSSLVQALTAQLATQLSSQQLATPASALASQQFIDSARAKQQLAATYGVDVVDMEAKAILANFPADQVAMLRVVSDDCEHDLPDLSTAISPSGNLLPLPLIGSMLRYPIGMSRLIRGSMLGLRVLQQVTKVLFD